MNYELSLTHLYPNHLNIYGDQGNIIALTKRLEWRRIKYKVNKYNISSKIPEDTDLFFIGGGDDDAQEKVYKDLLKQRKILTKMTEKNIPLLAICGGYQLLGKYFVRGDGKTLKGINLLDVETKAPDLDVKSRAMNNIIVRINSKIKIQSKLKTLVGFENHSGQTFLGPKVQPLAKVLYGQGNNAKEKLEGAFYKNAFGTYLHGSFLPKNPHFADFLIQKSLEIKYNKNIKLKPLDDAEEQKAHQAILDRFL